MKGSTLYENFYAHDDHVEVASLVQALDNPWVVSYDAAPEVLKLYRGFERMSYDLVYSAGVRQHGREVMFFSKSLRRPAVASPSSVPASLVDRSRVYDLK